jgi:hypothetical protein
LNPTPAIKKRKQLSAIYCNCFFVIRVWLPSGLVLTRFS